MNFPQFLLILKAHFLIALFTLMVTLAGTYIISKQLPKSFKASTAVVLNYKGVDPVTGSTSPAQLLPGYMATQVDIITSSSVAMMVMDDLKLTEGDAVQAQFLRETKGVGTLRDWLSALLQKNLLVEPSKESSVLVIGFKWPEPNFAATVANAYANAYLKKSIELKVEPLKKAAAYFEAQSKVLQ